MAGRKSLDGAATMGWKGVAAMPDAQRWRTSVESGGVLVGDVVLFVNPHIPQHWNFTLQLRGYNVFGWHFRTGASHKNPSACGDGFVTTGRIKSPHEQWLNGPNLKCATALEGLDGIDHEQVFVRFCNRTNLDVGSLVYQAPNLNEQLSMIPEDSR